MGYKHIHCTVHGKHYNTMTEACIDNGVSRTAVHKKIMNGCTMEEAIDETIKNKKSRARYGPVTVNNVDYPSLFIACRMLNRNFSSLKRRIHEDGLTPDEAFNEPPARSPVVVDGVTYPSLLKACNAHKYEYQTIYMRIRRGCSVQKSFDIEKDRIENGYKYGRKNY